MKYLVYLKTPKKLQEKVEFYREPIAEQIKKVSSTGIHCTLMVSQFDQDKEEKMVDVLEGIVKSTFTASLVGSVEDFGRGTLVAPLFETDPLRRLHYQVIRRLKPFIDREKVFPLSKQFSYDKDRISAYKRYGSPFFAQFYNPHLTICQVDREKLVSVPQTRLFQNYSWEVGKFYLSKKTEEGWEEVREFLLQP